MVRDCNPDVQFTTKAPSAHDARLSASVAFASAVALTSGATSNITNITLTPGNWDVFGWVGHLTAATTSVTRHISSISTTSATVDATTPQASAADVIPAFVPGTSTSNYRQLLGPVRIYVAPSTTQLVYLVAQDTFSVSTASAFGGIEARKVWGS